MMRYASQSFSFHLIPAPHPPGATSFVDSRGRPKHCLWEGFGTLALVNKAHDEDRAMIVEVRPPSVVDSGVMREFVRPSRSEGWWHFPSDLCVGDVGQANLLQAQVYDDCVNNHVFYFAVTNIKYWVFGRFVSTTSARPAEAQGRTPIIPCALSRRSLSASREGRL